MFGETLREIGQERFSVPWEIADSRGGWATVEVVREC